MTDIVPREPTEASARFAHDIDQRLKANVKRLKSMWIELARDLYRFHVGELWRDLGYDSFERWLAEPELDLGRRWVYDLIAFYKQLVVDRQVDPAQLEGIGVSKVREVLPAIRRGQVTLDEALADARELRRVDLEERYRGRGEDGVTAGPDTSTAVRTDREPEWGRCGCCGSLIRKAPGG